MADLWWLQMDELWCCVESSGASSKPYRDAFTCGVCHAIQPLHRLPSTRVLWHSLGICGNASVRHRVTLRGEEAHTACKGTTTGLSTKCVTHIVGCLGPPPARALVGKPANLCNGRKRRGSLTSLAARIGVTRGGVGRGWPGGGVRA